MAEKRTATKKPARGAAKASAGFSKEEMAAMRDRARELKAAARRGAAEADGVQELLAKIAEMPEPDRIIAERLHALITASAPSLAPRTWYGMPAYARDGKVVCFFKPASKFKARYGELGFNDAASLDEGAMWPTAYALTKLTKADETKIRALVKKAAG